MSINIRPAPENLPSFTNDDFLLLKELCKILKPFDAVTKKLSEEQSTASSILSAFKTLKDFLERHSNNDKNLEESRSIAAKLHEAVTIRYERLQNDKILCISMLIDKRFAYDTNIKTPLEWLKIEEDFISYCKTELKLDGSEAITQTQSDATDVPMQFGDPMAQNSDSSDEDYDIFGKRAPTPALSQVSTGTDAEFTANIKSELAKFVSLEKPDPNTVNIFKWCRKYLGQFPVISKAAQALLSIPATSVCSERLFSKATLLYSNALRNRLESDTAENILIIKASLTQFPLQVTEEQESDEEDSMLELLILE
ncbi:zinc finger BED domain-containing protein 4 [Ditylenchus destructor]|uniref:Zinc finger BED domain-containing protein 4 n=1 Tax=Ditylenchus destructor TaxID=166010 RepID=A0AAD4N2I3_9BILA|nr:zinc finger BED domain-containing protein 4 [Ditylenchus destructor]